MHLVCPRCDAPFTSHDVQCHACGYRWQVPCAGCGKPNIPAARFCGACGMPLSLESRLWREVREFFAHPFGTRLRNMATGFAFGGLLTFFAFGTMGMSSPHHRLVEPDACPAKAARPKLHGAQASGIAFDGLQGWRSRAGESARAASLDDLMQVGRSLLDTLSPPDPDAE
ncbi:MAG TPA: zinc ribbon domain-containing protein, partial [Candidatus Ozemobacteraceae bacterium]|nr:zinc ribbon domain-containing protein [Candidatus Ozemobacteraceae bacterium]